MKARIFFTNFWTKPESENLNLLAKYLYLYISTNNRVNLLGLYYLPNHVIHFETAIDNKDIELTKSLLEECGYAYFFKGWVYLPDSQKLSGYANLKFNNPIEKELTEIPVDVLNEFRSMGYEIPYQYTTDSSRNKKEENRKANGNDIDISEIDFNQ